jgi:hypothetical protein
MRCDWPVHKTITPSRKAFALAACVVVVVIVVEHLLVSLQLSSRSTPYPAIYSESGKHVSPTHQQSIFIAAHLQ